MNIRSTFDLVRWLALLVALVLVPGFSMAQTTFTDISPDYSQRYAAEEGHGKWGQFAAGGRVNNLAAVPGSNQIFYAATEWGGLWKTTNAGDTWFHLFNHVPMAVWDVAVDPAQPSTVYATSFYDGRVNPVSGIQVSYNAGVTWTHPPTATPPNGIPLGSPKCTMPDGSTQSAPGEWSAFGIGIRPDAPQDVYIGTSCGVAISHDAGLTWNFVDPDTRPGRAGLRHVWDVVVQPGGPEGKGIVDVCGVEGHSRSTDGGKTWTPNNLPYPMFSTGRCSIAASPDEPYVLFVVDDITDPVPESQDPFPPDLHMLYESDDGGQTWIKLGNPFRAMEGNPLHPRWTKRLTFVVTNKRSASGGKERFDLWYGEVDIWRAGCETPTSPAPEVGGTTPATLRCPPAQFANGNLRWSGPPHWLDPFFGKNAGDPTTMEHVGAHGDSGDLAFDMTVSVDACPLLYASDGGIFINVPSGPIYDCHSPTAFRQPSQSPHALWLWGMAGSNFANGAVALQFGVQDNGSWAAPDAHSAFPTWDDGPTSDSFSRVADATQYLWNDQLGLHLALPGHVSGAIDLDGPQVPKPDGSYAEREVMMFGFVSKVDQTHDANGDREYLVVTESIDLDDDGDKDDPQERQKIFITDYTQNSFQWIELGSAPPPGWICGIQASVVASSGERVIYAQTGGSCNMGRDGGALYKYVGLDPDQEWIRVDSATKLPGGIGMFGVDPTNANRLYASNLCYPNCPDSFGLGADPSVLGRMMFSLDGGVTWEEDSKLNDVMTGKGLQTPDAISFKFSNSAGLREPFRAIFDGYAQPSLVAFDPYDQNIIVAGGRDSGVFLSTNGGEDWSLITDPLGSISDRPHIPRPHFAHFKHEPGGIIWLYLGTQGRGVWRLRIALPTADAGGPYTTQEGQNVSLHASGSAEPGLETLTFAWDLDNDGDFDDAIGENAVFDRVGQDGVFLVRVKVSVDGVFTIDESTVTVSNVVPGIMNLTSNGPKPENSPITIAGRIVDAGWHDALSATINWGDGTPLENVEGTLENNRPDAAFVFSTFHTYGDNGTFAATLCGHDDDSQICQTIQLAITNVEPTASVHGTVLVNGVPTVIAEATGPLTLHGRSIDPGSDDLTLTWLFDDGSPNATVAFLVNAPNPDPFPSPSIQPRDVSTTHSKSFTPCLYDVGFRSTDDDGATRLAQVKVLMTGSATDGLAAGYWQQQFAGKNGDFTSSTLGCYLEIVSFVSTVFNDVTDASTIERAFVVLKAGNGTSVEEQFDRQLLAALLNLANGAPDFDELIDTDHDRIGDTPFLTIVANAAAARTNTTSTDAQIIAEKDLLERINLGRR